MKKPVVIYGSRKLAKMIFYDAQKHADFRIAAFAVDAAYLNADRQFLGLPQASFESLAQEYPPWQYDLLALHAGTDSMRERARFYARAKESGFQLQNYISSSCDWAQDVQMGDNNIILAQSHIGLGGVMGSNNLIRQQTYLGHDFIVGDHNILTPGCRIGGLCKIGSGCYLGLGCIVINRMVVDDETLVGAGTVVIRPTEPHTRIVGNPGRVIGEHKETGICLQST